MNRMHLWQLDLNLLVILDVLLEERSVTRAARRLGRTQSAVSHALGRLRDALGDELLVRDGRGMRPTARGEVLGESLPRVLELLTRTLAEPEAFDPTRTTRTFRLAAPDFLATALPRLLAAVHAVAPGARVELVRAGGSVTRDVAEGRYDGVVMPPHPVDGLRATPLGTSAWRVFARREHPFLAEGTAAAWARYPHLRVTTRGDGPGPVDEAAAAAGLSRTIGAVVPHFAVAPAVLRETDLLLTVPAAAMAGMDGPFELGTCPPPFALPPMPLSLHRSAVVGTEPGVAWFLAKVEAVVAALLAAST